MPLATTLTTPFANLAALSQHSLTEVDLTTYGLRDLDRYF